MHANIPAGKKMYKILELSFWAYNFFSLFFQADGNKSYILKVWAQREFFSSKVEVNTLDYRAFFTVLFEFWLSYAS